MHHQVYLLTQQPPPGVPTAAGNTSRCTYCSWQYLFIVLMEHMVEDHNIPKYTLVLENEKICTKLIQNHHFGEMLVILIFPQIKEGDNGFDNALRKWVLQLLLF